MHDTKDGSILTSCMLELVYLSPRYGECDLGTKTTGANPLTEEPIQLSRALLPLKMKNKFSRSMGALRYRFTGFMEARSVRISI